MKASNRPVLHWYVFGVLALSLVLLLNTSWAVPEDQYAFRNAVTVFILLGALAEAGFLKMRVAAVTSSIAFIPFLASVILFPPAWVMVVCGVTEFVAETAIRRKRPIKIVHNTAKEVLAVGVAALAYSLFGGEPSFVEFAPSAPGFLAAIIVYFTISEGATVLAVALSARVRISEAWRQVVGGSLLQDFATGPIAILLAFLYVRLGLIGILVVTVPLFFVRHIYQMTLRLEQVNAELLELMVKSIEARDPYTSGHSLRVSRLAKAMAQELSLPAKKVEEIATAALLHDVGKIYQEFAPLLRKEGKLLPHEKEMMQSHPVRSAELVATISTMRGELEKAVRHHHENFNGCGYPDGLMGEEIPIGSRIITIADTVDAMTTDRPYRKALPYERVTQELATYRGKQFDPTLVDLFCSSPRIQEVVNNHVRRRREASEPKTVGETIEDLRRVLGTMPNRMLDAGATRWQRVRAPDGSVGVRRLK